MQHVDGLGNRRSGCRGFAQGVEHHEVMDGGVVAHASAAHAGGNQLVRVGFALVAQRVVFVDDDERLGQAGEFVDAGPQRREWRYTGRRESPTAGKL